MNSLTRILSAHVVLAILCAAGIAVPLATSHSAAAQPRAAASSAEPPAAVIVDLSTATATELQQIPGIGPTRAQAIIDLRQRGNGFERVEDVLRVRGIGRATFRRIRPMLRVSRSTSRRPDSARGTSGDMPRVQARRPGPSVDDE